MIKVPIPVRFIDILINKAIDAASRQLEQYKGTRDLAESIKSLRTDAKFRKRMSAAIKQTIPKFGATYRYRDEEVTEVILRSTERRFSDPQFQDVLISILEQPDNLLSPQVDVLIDIFYQDEQKSHHTGRLREGVLFFIGELTQAIWLMPEFNKIYSVMIQRKELEALNSQVSIAGEIRDSIRTLTEATLVEGNTLLPPLIAARYTEKKIDWGEAPNTNGVIGRDDEVKKMTSSIRNGHLIGIIGLGGIGKTLLATKVAREVAGDFEFVFWRSLRNAPPAFEVLAEFIQLTSHNRDAGNIQATRKQLERCAQVMRDKKCLIILDNFESVLEEGGTGQYRPDYEVYGEFLHLVGRSEHKSCVLVTSRETPREMAEFTGDEGAVRTIALEGLSVEDVQAILRDRGLQGNIDSWKTLVEVYSGNPLVLHIVAEMIREVYFGSIGEFLEDGEPIFGRIQELLDEQFNRLSSLEQTLLYWLAVERETVSRDSLLDNLVQSVGKRDLMMALRSLRRRNLIEQTVKGFTLQNVVLEYVTSRLVEQIYEDIRTGRPNLTNKFALLKVSAKEYVRRSQERLIVHPIANRLMEYFRNGQRLGKHIQSLLDTLRSDSFYKSGYAAGNLLNLLVHLNFDLTGYDFSELPLWEAYLQNTKLHQVNFSYCDLSRTIFTHAFSLVLSITTHPEYPIFAAGIETGEIRLWNYITNKPVAVYETHVDSVWGLKFSSTGKLLASSSSDQTISIRNVETGQLLHTLTGHTGWVTSLKFVAEDTQLLSASVDGTIRIWDVNNGTLLQEWQRHNIAIWSIDCHIPSRKVVSTGSDGAIHVWDLESGQCECVLEGHEGLVKAAVFSFDGALIASVGEDTSVRLWDTQSMNCVAILHGHEDDLRAVRFSPDGYHLATAGNDRVIRIWNMHTHECVKTFIGHHSWIRSLDFSSDGQFLITGSDDQSVRIWDVAQGHCLSTLRGQINLVWAVDINSENDLLASGSEDRSVRLWDLNTYRVIQTFAAHEHRVLDVCFSADSQTLVSCGEDNMIYLWNTITGKRIGQFQGHRSTVWSIQFSIDGQYLVSGSEDMLVKLWAVASRQVVKEFAGHTNWVLAVAISNDSNLMASGSADQTIRIWDISTGECLHILHGHHGWITDLEFTPDGKLLVSSSEDWTIGIWDVNSGKLVNKLLGHENPVKCVAIGPDGDTIASGSGDKTIRLWSLSEQHCFRVLSGHLNQVWSVAFTSDGKRLASCGNDQTIRVWEIDKATSLAAIYTDRPYEGLNISGASGLTQPQIRALSELGAISLESTPF